MNLSYKHNRCNRRSGQTLGTSTIVEALDICKADIKKTENLGISIVVEDSDIDKIDVEEADDL